MPRTRCARSGAAAAQRPKAPSTWTQAPAAWAGRQISPTGSKAPVFTLPACTQTIVGPEIAGSASARIRPWPSTGHPDRAPAAEAEQAERLDQRRMGFVADDHRDRRRAD